MQIFNAQFQFSNKFEIRVLRNYVRIFHLVFTAEPLPKSAFFASILVFAIHYLQHTHFYAVNLDPQSEIVVDLRDDDFIKHHNVQIAKRIVENSADPNKPSVHHCDHEKLALVFSRQLVYDVSS